MAGLGLVLLSLGCFGTSPSVSYYVLAPGDAGAEEGRYPELALSVGPVSLPRMLEQPQLAIRRDGNRVDYDEYNRWAGSLVEQVGRALGEGLARHLGTDRIAVYPNPAPFPVDHRVVVDVQELDARAGEAVVLRARYAVLPGAGGHAQAVGQLSFREPLSGDDPADVLAGHDAVVSGMIEALAARIEALQP